MVPRTSFSIISTCYVRSNVTKLLSGNCAECLSCGFCGYTSKISNSCVGNGFHLFISGQIECQLAIICASVPYIYIHLDSSRSIPIVFYTNNTKQDSVISRVSSSLSGQIRRLPFGHKVGSTKPEISRPIPHAAEIPEWEFDMLEPRQHDDSRVSRVDSVKYEQYVRGQFGPPVPPKDSRMLFDEYRREHGGIV
jgi:hypothetical protein